VSGAAIGYLSICVVVGIALIVYSLIQRNRVKASRSWQTAMGTIVKAEVVEGRSTDSVEYSVSVAYDYVVNGVRCTGKRIGFGARSYIRKKKAQEQLERYPVNSSVTVYFNPEKPEESILVREAPYTTLNLAIGIAILGLAVLIVVLLAAGLGTGS
jgi:uncharacterized membrane protein